MSHHKIEYDCQCESCKSTGLYVGIAEREGFAVVCYHCRGTGKKHAIIEYDDFNGKGKRENVTRVLQVNPGIVAGVNPAKGATLESFGGMPYQDWLDGKPFPPLSEMRQFTCPAWWYQSANYKKKPSWHQCMIGGTFHSCEHFATKEKCWERFDKQ